jgi:hypothetical protein
MSYWNQNNLEQKFILSLDGRTIINNVFQVLYVVKPVAHLCSMLLFGQKDWKPWLLSLAVDLSRYYNRLIYIWVLPNTAENRCETAISTVKNPQGK